MSERAQKLKKKSRIWGSIALLTFLIGGLLLYFRVSYDLRDFYEENFDLMEFSDHSANPVLAPSFSLYEHGQYRSAFDSVELIEKESTLSSEARLMKGLCLMKSEQYWEAISEFQKLKDSKSNFTQQAEWYKILSLIALNEKEKAIELLNYYVAQEGFEFKKIK